MVHKLICLTALLLELHPINCGRYENVTVCIGTEYKTATVTFASYKKDDIQLYNIEVYFTDKLHKSQYFGVAAKVLPGFGHTETFIHYNTKKGGHVSSDAKKVSFYQVKVEPEDTIVVAGKQMTAVRGVFEPTAGKFIVLKSTLGRGANDPYKKLKHVKDALKKPDVQNISKVAYMIRVGEGNAKYYSTNFEKFQDKDFQNLPTRYQEEKTLVLKLSSAFSEIDESVAGQVHWIKVNENVIMAKADIKYTDAKSIGGHILRNKDSQFSFTCIENELKSLIATSGKTKLTEIGLWGPLSFSHIFQTRIWQTLTFTEPVNIETGKIEAKGKYLDTAVSITVAVAERGPK